MEPKVSIILPVYNVEEYLEQCLESIAAQTYQNYEVILIIDGSPDGSYDIAKRFCSCHDKFKVYWQENAGSGPARNNGIEHSSGDFIMFIDPDDWIDKDYVEKLVSKQQEGDYDIVSGGGRISIVNNGHESFMFQKFTPEVINGKDNVRNAYARLLVGNRVGGPHRKIYKASIIRDNRVCFPDYRRSQDVVFNFRYYNYISSICIIPLSGYNYRAATAGYIKFKYDYYKTVVLIYNDIKELHHKWGVSIKDGILASFFLDYIVSHVSWCFDRNMPVSEILNDTTISEIVKTARPTKKHLAIAQFFLNNRMFALLKLYYKSLHAYRKDIKSLFVLKKQ